MKPLPAYPLFELKLVYRVLHAALLEHEELLDADLLADLQAQLRALAAADDVDTSDHGAWDRWLCRAPASPSAPTPVRLHVLPGGQR